jgi:hypothetical protein
MNLTRTHILLIGVLAIVLASGALGFQLMRAGGEGFQFTRVGGAREGFESPASKTCGKPKPRVCGRCNRTPSSCICGPSGSGGSGSGGSGSGGSGSAASIAAAAASIQPAPIAPCPRTQEPDLSKYILKSQVPSTNSLLPDMSNYMLKTECPPVPDLSKYVLKSSIPKPQPVIIDNSSCKNDAGECPPCPRPRCPEVKCPPPTKCDPPAPCPRPVCPPTVVKCKSEESTSGSTVRPFLAPLSMSNFGMA